MSKTKDFFEIQNSYENTQFANEAKVKLDLLQQQEADLMFLEQQGHDVSAAKEMVSQMIEDEYTVYAHYSQFA